MKQNVLDVLMYMFEHCFEEDTDVEADRDILQQDLVQAGFPESEITMAFDWLEGLTTGEEGAEIAVVGGSAASRVYAIEESGRLGTGGMGLLVFLEQVGVLDSTTRELVIDRVMALGSDELDLEQLKWVVLLVMFNQPGRESMFQWMEDVVYDREYGVVH